MRFYFCYEQGPSGLWSPVLYHNEPPKIRDGYTISTNGVQKPVTAPVAYDSDEEPSFATMQKLFPRIKEEEMVRPIEGFQTNDGKFFDDEHEATIHETTYALTASFYERVSSNGWTKITDLPDATKDIIVQEALRFIDDNREHITRYLEATQRTQVDADNGVQPDRPETAIAS